MKKKALFFLPSSVGGAERMTITYAKMLPLDEFDVKFVIVHRTLGSIVDFIPKDYKIIHIPVHNIYCLGTFRIFNVIRKEKPHIVFSSLLYLNARLIVAAKLYGCKVIVRNNIDLSKTKSRIVPFLIKHTYGWADTVIAQQEEMRKEILEFTDLSEQKVVTINNPIDVEFIQKKKLEQSPFKNSSCQVNFVCVGRFCSSKGQDLIIRAFELVKKTCQNAHLYLVGKFDMNLSYDKNVHDFIEKHHLKDCIHCVGFQKNPYVWVTNCDCYVMPSRSEGLPNALIDAMYLGKPVVATKCIPVIERIVQHGYNGILVDTENIEQLAKGMIEALSLKDFKMTYQPATRQDIVPLFG